MTEHNMSGPSKELDEIGAGSSGMLASSEMEGEDEYYNPDGTEWSQKAGLLCRICANPNEYLIPIFDGEGLEHELGTKIQKHLPIKVTETDTLPIHVCYQCASTLIAWHDLVNCCVEADKKLRELQMVEDDEDDDDKGAEMFESHSFDSEMVAEDDGPSTSELQNQAPEIKSPKKLTVDKKSKLKMVLVKGSAAGTSGQKIVPKIQVAKVELGKPKEGTSQDSASERFGWISKKETTFWHHTEEATKLTVEDCKDISLQKVDFLSSYEEPLDDLSAYEVFDVKSLSRNEQNKSSCDFINCLKSEIGNESSYDIYLKEHDYVTGQHEHLYHCQHCGREFDRASFLKQHLKAEHKELTGHKCQICNETFMSKKKLLAHRSTHDPDVWNELEVTHLCHTCGKTFNTSNKLRWHEKRVHRRIPVALLGEKKHTCEVCGSSFQLSRYLRKHMLKHGEKNFVCETCGKQFITNYKLKIHQECHSEQRPYSCKICASTHKRYRNLLSHEQEVHGIYPLGPGKVKESLSFPCEVCKKEFTTPKRVADHMRIHTGERPFSCEQCGRTYRVYVSLFMHRRAVHEGRKITRKVSRKVYGNKGVFLCEECGKVFSTKQYKNIHLRIHKGEKPYVCKVCNRAFTHRTTFVNHSALHTDIRPYSCHLCEKTFRRRGTLILHIRTHTGEKPYSCEICGRGFAQLNDMKKHRLKIHNVIIPRKN